MFGEFFNFICEFLGIGLVPLLLIIIGFILIFKD